MEFADLIKISRIDNVRVRRAGKPCIEATVAVTGHHLIISSSDTKDSTDREMWLLHRGILSVSKETESNRSGTLLLKYKDMRVFNLDIIGQDCLTALTTSLQALSNVEEQTSSYPFFYNPGFKGLEDGWCLFRPEEEYCKLIKGAESTWRVSRVNHEFSVCATYGKLLIVPTNLTDSQILTAAKHRVGGRFPVPCYLHNVKNDSIPLARGSYTVAGWRNGEDEKLMAGIRGNHRKGFIICIHHDKMGGGKSEYDTVYAQWKRVNLRLPSLSELRESLNNLSAACNDPGNDKWISKLASAHWLAHVKDVLNAACLAAQLIEKENAPVVVIEQEAADLSLILVSLAQIILNPDSRTLHGLEALIERDWIQGGYAFWTRHGSSSPDRETAPVFLLFLDAVFQIYTQFPYSFEFTDRLLVVLGDHSVSSPFGTFLSDCEKERSLYSVREQTVSLWSYLNQVEILSSMLNSLYIPNNSVIWPSVASMSIILWTSYYLRWVQDQNNYTYERRKITEIIERNKTAKLQALRLRRELQELQDEALSLGLLCTEDTERRDSENSVQN